jgi:hypothetical protein
MTSDEKAEKRKATPVYRGFVKYFPMAIQEVARCSMIANEQHNPNTEMHWDRSKSGDELDALARHLIDAGTFDDDGIRHSAKVAWRALANLEKELEKANESKPEDKSHSPVVRIQPVGNTFTLDEYLKHQGS